MKDVLAALEAMAIGRETALSMPVEALEVACMQLHAPAQLTAYISAPPLATAETAAIAAAPDLVSVPARVGHAA